MPSSSSGLGKSTQSKQNKQQPVQRRLSRNESEKLRRDKLNMHIAELAKLVPLVATAPRKLDKSSVLRLSVNYLRMHYEMKKAKKFDIWRPGFLSKEALGEMLLEAPNGILWILSEKGVILYVSHMISSLLGHSEVDVIGHSIYQFIHPDDVCLCKEQFQISERKSELFTSQRPSTCETASITTGYLAPMNGRRSFFVRMQNVLNKEKKSYEWIHLSCHVRTFDYIKQRGSQTVIVGAGRLVARPEIQEMTFQPTNMLEFTTQHSLDGKIIFADQRQALCNGRLPHEVLGTMPFDYLYEEDLSVVQLSHKRVMVDGEVSSTVFRIYGSNREIINLQARSTIWCDKWTKAPRFILSNNVVISEQRFSDLMLQQNYEIKKSLAQEAEDQDEKPQVKRCKKDLSSQPCSEMVDLSEQSIDPYNPSISTILPSNNDDLLSSNLKFLSSHEMSSDCVGKTGESELQWRLSPHSSRTSHTDIAMCSDEPFTPNSPSHSPHKERPHSRLGALDPPVGNGGQNFLAHTSLPSNYSKQKNIDAFQSISSQNLQTVASGCIVDSSRCKEDSLSPLMICSQFGSHRQYDNNVLPSITSSTDYKDPHSDNIHLQGNAVKQTKVETPAENQELDTKAARVEAQLANQLQSKYVLLEGSLCRQESELSSLKDELLKYLLTHPEARESYLHRLEELELKRQKHEKVLKKLQDLYESRRVKTSVLEVTSTFHPDTPSSSNQDSNVLAIEADNVLPTSSNDTFQMDSQESLQSSTPFSLDSTIDISDSFNFPWLQQEDFLQPIHQTVLFK